MGARCLRYVNGGRRRSGAGIRLPRSRNADTPMPTSIAATKTGALTSPIPSQTRPGPGQKPARAPVACEVREAKHLGRVGHARYEQAETEDPAGEKQGKNSPRAAPQESMDGKNDQRRRQRFFCGEDARFRMLCLR